jgi:hypothetical protein
MSFDYYGCGMYGVALEALMPEEVYQAMVEVALKLSCSDLEPLYIPNSYVLKPRFAKVQAANPSRWNKMLRHEDWGSILMAAYEKEFEAHVPGFKKGRKYWAISQVAGDVIGASDLKSGDLIFGVSVYNLPLQRRWKRGRLPDEFVAIADTHLWVEGG